MLRVEDLRIERDNPNDAWIEFVLNNAKYPTMVHIFVEGYNDTSFYRNFIKTHALQCKREYTFYRCGDKSGVYDAHKLVRNTNLRATSVFFVDKDFSDILDEKWEKSSNIYITDYHSIENYLVTKEMFSHMWIDFFHFTKGTVTFNKLYPEKFQTELERFYQLILPIIAWYIHLKRNGKHPNIKNVHFSNLFRFKDDLTLTWSKEAESTGSINLLEQYCGVKTLPTWPTESNQIIEELSSLPPKCYVRGKLELDFLLKFIDQLVKTLDKEISELTGGRAWINVQIHEKNAVDILGPKALIPSSLNKFLNDNQGVRLLADPTQEECDKAH